MFSDAELPALPNSKVVDSSDETLHSQLENVERKYGASILVMQIRLADLFKDFDPMRSGLMSESRFIRCVSASLARSYGRNITEAEMATLVDGYRQPGTKMVKWREFVAKIDKVFEAQTTEDGHLRRKEQPELPFRRPLSPSSLKHLSMVIERLKSYGNHHGADPKSWFHDFDKNSKGWVNYNQFRRGMPQNLISAAEEDLLIARYGDSNSETVDYFKLHTDVTRKSPTVADNDHTLGSKTRQELEYNDRLPIGTEELLNKHTSKESAIDEVESSIRQYVYKTRIILSNQFRDFDKLNSGVITLTQFHGGLDDARVPASSAEVKVLADKYKTNDGRINYREFCKSIDSVFTVNNLENNPLQKLPKPSLEWLAQNQRALAPEEEIRFQKIMQSLQSKMREKRIALEPFFKDFDKSIGNLGRVTRSHFSRLLNSCGLDVSGTELHILFKKFEDKPEGRINYRNFLKQVDPDTYYSYHKPVSAARNDSKVAEKAQRKTITNRDMGMLIKKLQGYAVTRRIRVEEPFKDFDKLRSYSIPREEFKRGIFTYRFGLTENDAEMICNEFQDPIRKDCCLWKKFVDQLNVAFGESNLESRPDFVHDNEIKISPFSNLGEALTPEEETMLKKTIEKIRFYMKEHRPSIKPFFRDCDKINSAHGHVTKSQLRQCLAFIGVDVTEEEFNVICKKWKKAAPETHVVEANYISDTATNICYIHFLEEIERGIDNPLPTNFVPQSKLIKKKEEVNKVRLKHSQFDVLMMKMKIKTKTERMQIKDALVDFDKLKHGKIPRDEFRRAMKLAFSSLKESELRLLEEHYADENGMMFYSRLIDDIESVFTKKGLEANPTDIPEPFEVYSNGWGTEAFEDDLSAEDKEILPSVMNRIQKRIKARRIDALSYMADYDYVNEGTITTNQFRSVLNQMDLGVTDTEFNVIVRFFASDHSRTRVNYRKLALYGTLNK